MTSKLALALASMIAFASPTYSYPANWVELKASDAFTMQAPPRSQFRAGKGIDSFVGSFYGPGFRMSFDYGAYSPQLDLENRNKDDTWEKAKIGGRVATITSGAARNHVYGCRHYFVAAYSYYKAPFAEQPASLFIVACVNNRDKISQADMMLRSIRFRR